MSLESTIALINKKYGRAVLVKGSDAGGIRIHKVRTGSIALDIALKGGVALNKLVQVSGQFSAGKSSLCALIAKNFTENNIHPPVKAAKKGKRYIIYVDLERTFDPKWFKYLGVDMRNFIWALPVGGEETWDVACDIMDHARDNGDQTITFIDSLAAAIPMIEVDKETAKKSAKIASHAELTSRGIKKFLHRLKTNILDPAPEQTMVFVNQTRLDIMKSFGDPEMEMGGKAPGFFSSQIIRARRNNHILSETIKDKRVGYENSYSLIKEKTGGDERMVVQARFYRDPDPEIGIPGGCFDNERDIIPYAVKYGVIERNGAYYKLNGKILGQGESKVALNFRKNPERYEEVEAKTLLKSQNERDEYATEKKNLKLKKIPVVKAGKKDSK